MIHNAIETLDSLRESAIRKSQSGDLRITAGARNMIKVLEEVTDLLKNLPNEKQIYSIVSEWWDNPKAKDLSRIIFKKIRG